MELFNTKKTPERELGFGNKKYGRRVRFINSDGSVNVRRTGLGRLGNLDVYHWFITVPLPRLIVIILCGYILINTFFAVIYYLIGAENFGGVNMGSETSKFLSLYFFSAQTLTTLGYGQMHPVSVAASTVSAVESLVGLISFALATGIVYGRFSRPKADLVYSRNILIAPYQGITGLMFRITNKMQYELIECEANVTITYNDPETGKHKFDQLKLEINRINFLTLSWTIVHPIDEESPIKGWSLQEIQDRDTEIIILIKAINDTFSQTVYSRHSYKSDEMVEKAKFKPLNQEPDESGRIVISVHEIHEYVKEN